MRALIQRVSRAEVRVDGEVIGRIGPGLLVLLGVGEGDGESAADYLADKIAHLRIFEDDNGKMNVSLLETAGSVLAVPQFTLYGDTRKGRRPNFIGAARPETAAPLFDYFVQRLRALGIPTETGRFGAYMQVELVNDGPVTLWLDTDAVLGS